MKVNYFIVLALLSVFAIQAHASPGYAYPKAGQGLQRTEPGPGVILKEGMTKLLKFMRQQDRPDATAINTFLETQIAPYFDFAYMARWAAGPAYRNMNEEQRNAMAQDIKKMLLSALSQRLGSYQNQDVRFYRPRRAGPNELKVRVGILQSGGYPANIDFRFYRSDAGWKVFDVSGNGTSALTHYRQYFAQQMRKRRVNWAYRR